MLPYFFVLVLDRDIIFANFQRTVLLSVDLVESCALWSFHLVLRLIPCNSLLRPQKNKWDSVNLGRITILKKNYMNWLDWWCVVSASMTVSELSCSCQNLVLEAMDIGRTYYIRWHLQPSTIRWYHLQEEYKRWVTEQALKITSVLANWFISGSLILLVTSYSWEGH